jgi:hypothetical protein
MIDDFFKAMMVFTPSEPNKQFLPLSIINIWNHIILVHHNNHLNIFWEEDICLVVLILRFTMAFPSFG